MTKLTKTLLIGGTSTVVVGGGAAGAAVAISHNSSSNAKKDDAKNTPSTNTQTTEQIAAQKAMLKAIADLDRTQEAAAQASRKAELAAIEAAKHDATSIEGMDKTLAELAKSNSEAEKAAILQSKIEDLDRTLDAQATANRNAELEAKEAYRLVHEQMALDQQEWDSMFRVDNILKTANGYLKFFLQEGMTQINNAQLSKFIFAIDDFVEAQDTNTRILETYQVLAETLIDIITPKPIAQLTPTIIAPEAVYTTDGKLVATHAEEQIANKAGDVVEVIKTMLLQKHSANELLKAESGKYVGFPAYNNLKNIQEDIRNILLTVFPSAEREIKALPAEALYYAEKGASVYGIKFQLLDYLLNPANKDVVHFSNFAKAKWTRDEAQAKFYDIDFVGTSNLDQFDHNDYGQNANQDVRITNFLKALDAHIFAKSFGENLSQTNFAEAVSKFAPTVENSANTKAVEWALNSKNTVFNGENGSKFVVSSAEVDKTDMTLVHVKFIAFGNQNTIPMYIERTISGFKKPSDHSFDIVWSHLKETLPASIINVSSQKSAPNHWQNVARGIVKFLEEKYPALKSQLDATLANLDGWESPTKMFWGFDGSKGFLGMIKDLSATSFAEIKSHIKDEIVHYNVGNRKYFDAKYSASITMASNLLDALEKASQA